VPNPEAYMMIEHTMLVMSPVALLNILERASAGEDIELIMLEILDICAENHIKLGDTENGGR
jgi:hypothetical protein